MFEEVESAANSPPCIFQMYGETGISGAPHLDFPMPYSSVATAWVFGNLQEEMLWFHLLIHGTVVPGKRPAIREISLYVSEALRQPSYPRDAFPNAFLATVLLFIFAVLLPIMYYCDTRLFPVTVCVPPTSRRHKFQILFRTHCIPLKKYHYRHMLLKLSAKECDRFPTVWLRGDDHPSVLWSKATRNRVLLPEPDIERDEGLRIDFVAWLTTEDPRKAYARIEEYDWFNPGIAVSDVHVRNTTTGEEWCSDAKVRQLSISNPLPRSLPRYLLSCTEKRSVELHRLQESPTECTRFLSVIRSHLLFSLFTLPRNSRLNRLERLMCFMVCTTSCVLLTVYLLLLTQAFDNAAAALSTAGTGRAPAYQIPSFILVLGGESAYFNAALVASLACLPLPMIMRFMYNVMDRLSMLRKHDSWVYRFCSHSVFSRRSVLRLPFMKALRDPLATLLGIKLKDVVTSDVATMVPPAFARSAMFCSATDLAGRWSEPATLRRRAPSIDSLLRNKRTATSLFDGNLLSQKNATSDRYDFGFSGNGNSGNVVDGLQRLQEGRSTEKNTNNIDSPFYSKKTAHFIGNPSKTSPYIDKEADMLNGDRPTNLENSSLISDRRENADVRKTGSDDYSPFSATHGKSFAFTPVASDLRDRRSPGRVIESIDPVPEAQVFQEVESSVSDSTCSSLPEVAPKTLTKSFLQKNPARKNILSVASNDEHPAFDLANNDDRNMVLRSTHNPRVSSSYSTDMEPADNLDEATHFPIIVNVYSKSRFGYSSTSDTPYPTSVSEEPSSHNQGLAADASAPNISAYPQKSHSATSPESNDAGIREVNEVASGNTLPTQQHTSTQSSVSDSSSKEIVDSGYTFNPIVLDTSAIKMTSSTDSLADRLYARQEQPMPSMRNVGSNVKSNSASNHLLSALGTITSFFNLNLWKSQSSTDASAPRPSAGLAQSKNWSESLSDEGYSILTDKVESEKIRHDSIGSKPSHDESSQESSSVPSEMSVDSTTEKPVITEVDVYRHPDSLHHEVITHGSGAQSICFHLLTPRSVLSWLTAGAIVAECILLVWLGRYTTTDTTVDIYSAVAIALFLTFTISTFIDAVVAVTVYNENGNENSE